MTATLNRPAAPTSRRPSATRTRMTNNALLVGVFVAFLAIWQIIVAVFEVPKYLLPSPTAILSTFTAAPMRYVNATLYTGMEAVIGLAFAIVLGLGMAVIISRWRLVDRILTPYLVLLQVIPTIAIAPLLTIWLGYGIEPKIATAFLTSFFPIVITTAVGLRSADRDVLDMLRVISASGSFVFWHARAKFALPHFLSALKVAVPGAVIGAIIGEFISSTNGLGYIIMTAQARLDTSSLFVAILGSAVLGVATFAATSFAEKRLLHWHESQLGQA